MKQERRSGLVGPILLIGAGLLFLLNNLGVVDWSIWRSLLSLWPIILIGIGLDLLIGRRSMLGSLIVAAVVLVLLFGGAWYLMQGASPAGALTTHTISQPLEGVTQADMEIKAGAGNLRLGPLTGDDQLIDGTVKLRPNQRLEEAFSTSGAKASYRLAVAGPSTILAPTFSTNNSEQWDLGLGQEAAIDLDLSLGAGEARVDLGRIDLSQLNFHLGVGDATLDLPSQGQFQATVDGGIGRLIVRIPPEMAARIDADSSLGSVDVNGDFQRQDGLYVTPGYDEAENQVEIKINIGIGSVVIESHSGS